MLAWIAPLQAADPHAHHHTIQRSAEARSVEFSIPEAELVDQKGRTVKLPEALEGKVLIMDFVYTHCTTVCPVLSVLFAGLQERLGERLGKDVLLVSVTVDPARDTPERLAAYAERVGAKPGWLWLTGPKPEVKRLLEAAGAYTPDFQNHPAMVLVGQDKIWYRFYGFPPSGAVLAKVEACR